ncbi:MAG: D-beta-D-heptose 1-phosphate adenosyltransferase, partial [Actinomycetia bacterium]|nr:D-beta-D-heptose 1-phosphate adenosyltransferase [Actinomycetes bacterium]
DFLRDLTVTTAFVSASGFTVDEGLSTSRTAIADTLKAAIYAAGTTVALVDSSKFRRGSLMAFAGPAELDLVITDDGLDRPAAEELRRAGINLESATVGVDR